MSDEPRREVARMLAQLHQDSIKNNMYCLKNQLVFGDPLPQDNYIIPRSRFRNENGTLKADKLSLTPKQVSCIPQDIIDFYGISYSPTKFPSIPKRLQLRSNIFPMHTRRRDGQIGEFLMPALRPLLDGDDKEVLKGNKKPPHMNEYPCPLCYGHSFMDVCHNFPTVGMRVRRLRDINYTMFLEGRHQVCPSCMKREYGHFSHKDCATRLSCSFCRCPGHDSTLCTTAAHISSLGDRFMDPGVLSRTQASEAILAVDTFKHAEILIQHRQRRRENLTLLARISNTLDLKVFPAAAMNAPPIRDAVPPRWGIDLSIFKPVPLERAKKNAADLAQIDDPLPPGLPSEPVNDIAEAALVLPRQEQIIQDDINESAGTMEDVSEQDAKLDVAAVLPLQEKPVEQNIGNDIINAQHDEIEDQAKANENATEQVAEHDVANILPLQEEIQQDVNNIIDDEQDLNGQAGANENATEQEAEPVEEVNLPHAEELLEELLQQDIIDNNAPEKEADCDIPEDAILPHKNEVVQSDARDSESGGMDYEQYQSYIEHSDNDEVDPDAAIKDIFEEKDDEDGPQY